MSAADDLLSFIDVSPTPFHACATAAAELDAAGFTELAETAAWPTGPGRHYVRRSGSLVAWSSETASGPGDGFRVLGAHTDSPNLRVKAQHDLPAATGAGVLALEPYGGPLLRTWFDRDLGVAGRLTLRDGSDRLVVVDEPVLRVASLAIHLDRQAELETDRQRHLNAVWSVEPGSFLTWLCRREGIDPEAVLGFELMAFDTAPGVRAGADAAMIATARLDNQATCFAGLRALLGAEPPTGVRPVLALFDHEEVGSTSERGADSDLLATVIERIVLAAGGSREDYHRAVAASICVSGDMAHATHPNYADRHEPLHPIGLGGGPVLKINQNLRYATDAAGAAFFARVCQQAGVPLQRYVHRADLPCGSTIGPVSAARTGMLTVDVGAPQLAMHAVRETMAAVDVEHYVAALTAVLEAR